MSINAATSSTTSVSSSSASSQVSSASNSDSAKKTSNDSSFKDEMNKVSSADKSKDENKAEKTDSKVEKVSEKAEEKGNSTRQDTDFQSDIESQLPQGKAQAVADKTSLQLEAGVDYSNFASMSVMDANSMLTNDIALMTANNRENIILNEVNPIELDLSVTTDKSNKALNASISMSQADADFFINLTQNSSNDNISVQNIVSQAQTMVTNGAEESQVKQSAQVSQTLLNALSEARENNQPLRIDFDQNVSVILRVNKEGVISANFIPGDKTVEQYLRNNMENLKATFRDNELPYSDLSYSNRGSRQQKENRRNKQ